MERLLVTGRRYVARLAALVVLGLTLALVTGVSQVAASPAPASISIAPKAYVYQQGVRLEAQVTIQCTGGIGNVFMQVTQTAAQSSNGLGASGSQFVETANCDGSPHKLDVTIARTSGGLFDIGTATAHAQLLDPATGFVAGDDRTIAIVSV
jgi:hypothetical protein